MRLPTFYEQNLIPNWGIFRTFAIGILGSVSLIGTKQIDM